MDKAQLNKAYFQAGDWLHTMYKGRKIFKYTADLWRYREIIHETDPDLIIETGTLDGGSAMWFRDNSNAHIISIDVNDAHLKYPGVKFIVGDSIYGTDFMMDGTLQKYKSVMVVLDSNHSKYHVANELEKYSWHVSKGCYLVVEDTFISRYLNNEDPNNDYSNGSSWEAIQEWDSTGFEQEEGPFTLSMNPGGWFKRV